MLHQLKFLINDNGPNFCIIYSNGTFLLTLIELFTTEKMDFSTWSIVPNKNKMLENNITTSC